MIKILFIWKQYFIFDVLLVFSLIFRESSRLILKQRIQNDKKMSVCLVEHG